VAVEFDAVKKAASGKWLSVWRSLGINVNETGRHGPCPACSPGSKKSDRFRVDRNVAERGSYYCNGCGPGFGIDLVMRVLGIDVREAMEAVASIVGNCELNPVPEEKPVSPDLLRKTFIESAPIRRGDVAHRYLTNRGLKDIPGCLRHTRKCWNVETKQNEHALLAVFTGADNKAVTMQRIYLTPEGNKLPVAAPKMHMPCIGQMVGGAVRLYDCDSILGVAEGIETAIAAHDDLGIPVWATLSTSLMESFIPPPAVKEAIIIADNDQNFAGQKAAYKLANRLSVINKLSVQVFTPVTVGHDWLDVVNRQAHRLA